MSSGPPWCTTAARCCGFRSSSSAWVMRAVTRLSVGGATDARHAPASAWAGGKSFVRHERGRVPGEGFLPEEGRVLDLAVEVAGHAHEGGPDGDHERAAHLPVEPRYGPHRVVVGGGHVVVEPDAPAAEEEQDQAAEDRDDALHPQVAHAAGEVPPVVPGAGEAGQPVVEGDKQADRDHRVADHPD